MIVPRGEVATGGTGSGSVPVRGGGKPPRPRGGTGTDWPALTSSALASALVTANPGDTITLTAGVTYDTSSGFVLGNRGANVNTPITIRTSAYVTLPSRRMTSSDTSYMPLLRTTTTNTPVFSTAANADGWKLLGLEITATVAQDGGLVEFGTSSETVVGNQPDGIVVDRCYIHGVNDLDVVRGIAAHTQSFTLTQSEISQIWKTGQECQALWTCNGSGPFTVTNNYLSAMGQCFMSGGQDPAITNLVPSDFTFQDNRFAGPIEKNQYHTVSDAYGPAYDGRNYNFKNIFELKNARRVLVEHNLFEFSWLDAQDGYAILLTPRNQNNTAPWATVEDVTIRYNTIRHVALGMQLMCKDDAHLSDYMKRINIHHNVFSDVDWIYGGWPGTARTILVQLGGAVVVHGMDTLTIEHNTFDSDGTSTFGVYFTQGDGVSDSNKSANVTIQNNISMASGGGLAIFSDGGLEGTDAMTFGCQAGWVLTHNVFFGAALGTPSKYPNDWNETLTSGVGFQDYATHLYHLTSAGTGGDYRAGGSREATDHTDVGADTTLVP